MELTTKNQNKEHSINRLLALATDATSQLNVLGHDGDSLRVNGTKICILKQAGNV
jgi:hypothetical protein